MDYQIGPYGWNIIYIDILPLILGIVNGHVATDNILCNKLNIQP